MSTTTSLKSDSNTTVWNKDLEFFEYLSMVNPKMPPITYHDFRSELDKEIHTNLNLLDLSDELKTPFRATTPNTLIGFLYVKAKDSFRTTFNASSQIYFVIKGKGYTEIGLTH